VTLRAAAADVPRKPGVGARPARPPLRGRLARATLPARPATSPPRPPCTRRPSLPTNPVGFATPGDPAGDWVTIGGAPGAAGGREPCRGPRPRAWGDSPAYLSGVSNPKVIAALGGHPGAGVLVTPGTKSYLGHIRHYRQFALDNGCFGHAREFDAAGFLAL